MAPTNVTFRVSTIGQFSVQHFSYGKEAVDLTICCYVLGDFNRWWPWDGVQDPSSFQMLISTLWRVSRIPSSFQLPPDL